MHLYPTLLVCSRSGLVATLENTDDIDTFRDVLYRCTVIHLAQLLQMSSRGAQMSVLYVAC